MGGVKREGRSGRAEAGGGEAGRGKRDGRSVTGEAGREKLEGRSGRG